MIQPKPDPVTDLIAKAETEYLAGEERFKAGDLEASKRRFDHAMDMLLQSPAEVRSDERVQHELERVLESVNRPALAALQSDNPAPQQKAEPAPIDEVNDVTPPVDPSVKARAEAEIKATHSDLPLMLNDQVAGFINYFSTPRGHETLQHALERGGRYREMIESTLREAGRSAGADLSGAGGIWISSSGAVAGRGARHVAVHVQPSPRIWSAAQLVG